MTAIGDTGVVETGGLVLSVNPAEDGFSMLADQQSLLVQGAIQSLGDTSFSVFSQGVGNSISNQGQISASGSPAAAIATIGDGTVVQNSGSVIVTGPGAIGILSRGSQGHIVNSGTIEAYGAGSFGIITDVGGAQLVENSGNIYATGLGGSAIIVNSDNSTVVNSGGLYSDIQAIILSGDNATLDLEGGSRVQGGIAFTGANSHLIIGPGVNTALSFVAGPTSIATSGQPGVYSGGILAVVDPTGFETQSAGIHELGLAIQQAIDTHYAGVHEKSLWVRGFGRYSLLEGEIGVDYGTSVGGVLVGGDTNVSPGVRLGVFGGSAASASETEYQGQRSTADHLVAGFYASLHRGAAFADVAAIAGTSGISTQRNILNNFVAGGLETARADIDGVFFNPAITFGRHVDMGSFTVTPSVRTSYAAIKLDRYGEAGSIADLSVGKQRMDAIDIRAQLMLTTDPAEVRSGIAFVDGRFGFDAGWQKLHGVDAVLLAQAGKIDAATESSLRGFAGLGVNYVTQAGLALRASADAGLGSNGSFSAEGRFSVIAGLGGLEP